jgi:hypothetical protein
MQPTINIIYADDKDIYDLLQSGKLKFNKERILELLREHGMLISQEDEHDDLILYYSLLTHSHEELEHLLDIAEPGQRSENMTCSTIKCDVSFDQLVDAISKVEAERIGSESYNKAANQDTQRLTLFVNYTELDYGRTKLKQKRDKQSELKFSISDGGLSIRMPSTYHADNIKNLIIKKIEEIKKESVSEQKIELSGIKTPEGRTSFFTKLIRNLSGFEMENVSSVKVDREIAKETFEDEEEEEETTKETVEEGIVKKVLLDGEGLLYSSEYQELCKSGFYISKVVWTSRSTEIKGPIVEFEASLGNPPEGTDYKYAVKSVRKQKTDGSHVKNGRTPDVSEKNTYLKLLEQASWKSLAEISESEEPI